MAAIVSGGSLGLLQGSAALLGAQGQLGTAAHGRAGERVYVNAATGNLVIQGQDEVLIGRGPDASLLRTYNSRGLLDDDNADNWRVGLYRRVHSLTGTVNTAGSTVKRTDADGAEALYTYNTTLGKYVTAEGSGSFDTVSFASNVWTWTDGDTGVGESYDSLNGGRLTQVLDLSGNAMSFAYTGALLTSVSTASGETTYLDYSGNNLTQVRTVASGGATLIRTRYSYDGSNRLTQVTTDLSPQDASITDGKTYVTTYTYDGTSKRVASMTQTDGTSVAFTYVELTPGDWRVATITEAGSRVTSFSYNTAARTTTVTDPLGKSTVLAYDTSNRLTGITLPAVGGVSQQLAYAYDASGNVTSVTDAKGNSVVYAYDANGNRVYERDAAGNVVERVYGTNSRLLNETQYLVADPDGAGSAQPASPLTTRYVYDTAQRLRFVVSAQGRVTEHRYNGFGQRVASIEYTANTYNLTGLATTATLTEAQLTSWLPADKSKSVRVDTAYDFRGQVSKVTSYAQVDAAGAGVVATKAETTFVYDQAGNLLQTMDARSFQTAYVYDGLGRVLSTTDALGRTTLTDYQDAPRKTLITLANGLVRTSTYSAAGELISVLESAGSTNLGETKYFYDANGRLIRTEDPTGVKTHLLYDEAGRKVGEVDGDGSLTEYRYDANNNLTRSIRYANAVTAASITTLAAIRPAAHANDQSGWFAYDAANRLVKSVDAGGFVTQRFHDGAGRLTDQVRFATAIATASLGDAPAASAINPAANSADRLTRSFHDAQGKLLGTLDAEGYLVEHKYDAAGQLVETVGYATATNVSLRTTGTLDQLRPAGAAADVKSYVLYNARGQKVGAVDAQGYLTETVYDAAGNKTQVVRYATAVTYTSGATLASLRPAANAADQVHGYVYDGLNRVTSETNPEGTVTQYTYDEAGNLTKTVKAASTADARTLSAQYDKQGRLTAELSANGAALLTGGQTQAEIDAIWAQHAIKHTYDAAGRRTSSIDALGNKTLFYYDADGRLTHTINALGEVKQSSYNALGQLAQTIQYGTRLSGATLATLSGGLTNATLGAAVGGIANASLDSTVTYVYYTAGKLQQTTDALGNAVSQAWNAFGDLTSSTQAIGGGQTLVHQYTYDRRGLLTQTAWDPAGINKISVTAYDAFGRATQVTDANGNVRTSTYDRLGRVVTATDPSGSRTTTYDAFSRALTQTDRLGNVTTYAYNTAARSVTVTTPEGVALSTVRNRHGETATVTDGRGGVSTYAYDKNGNVVSATDAAGGVSAKAYDRADRLVETVDAGGNKVVFSYDAANRLFARRVDPDGLNLTTTYAYDAKGQTVAVTDAAGVVTQTVYDLKGQVASVTIDPGGLNLKTTFTYDARGKRLTVTEGADTAGARSTQYTYDKLGRLLAERVDPSGLNITTTYAYDKNDNVVSKTNGNGHVTRYFYDASDRLVFTLDALNGVTKAVYDAEGRVTQTIAYANAVTGLPGNPTLAQVQAAIVADGSRDAVTRSVYDKDGRELYSIDAHWGVTRKTYDANGNVVERIQYATPISSATTLTPAGVAAALATSSADRKTRVVYDVLNRAVYTLDALGAVTQNIYDANDKVLRAVGYANAVSLAGLPTAAQVAAALTPNAAADRSERRFYDGAGRQVYAVDAQGYVKESQYDALGRIAATIQYAQAIALDSTPTTAEVAAALAAQPAGLPNQVSAFAYDASGRLTASTDAEGFTEAFSYDAVGNKTSFTNKKGATWTYHYDANGRLTREISPAVAVTTVSEALAATTLTAPIETRIAYDALGNVTSRTEAYGLAGERTTTYVYDALGRQVRTNFPQVGVYDAAGDNLSTNGIAGAVTRTEISQSLFSAVTYNALGKAVVNRDAAGSYSYKVYDPLGRVKYEIDAERYVVQYNYDAFGGQTQLIRYATQISFAAHTDPAVPFTAAEVAGLIVPNAQDRAILTTYDNVGRPVEVLEPSAYTYDSTAAAASQYFTAGRTTKNTYDAFGNLLRQSSLKNPLTSQWADTYSYYDNRNRKIAQVDALGYLTRWEYDETGDVARQVEYAAALGAGTWSLAGFPANPATTTPSGNPGAAIGYDRETTYAYDRKNQKIAETRVNAEYSETSGALGLNTAVGNLTTTYGYDAVGNLVRVTDPAGGSTYTYYDALGRVTAVAETPRVIESTTGAVVMPPVHVSYSSGSNAATLSFSKQTSAGTVVDFRYAKAGTTNWTSVTPAVQGSSYVVALTGTTSDRYIYEITYTKAGESSPYATGSGSVSVIGPTSVGATNVVATVEQPKLNGSRVAYAHFDQVPGDEGGYTSVWNGYNRADLSWSSLDALGSGNVRVRLNYATYAYEIVGWDGESGYVYGITNNGVNTWRDVTLSASQGATGAVIAWTDSQPGAPSYFGLRAINSIQVWKVVDGQEILVHSGAPGTTQSERLLLRGNTAGLTGINVAGVGTLAATSMGAGVYSVNLGGLARKTYDFTPVGTASAIAGQFQVTKTTVAGNAVIQEINGGTNSAVLNAVNLPSTAAKALLEYRQIGETGPYLSKQMSGGAGNFTIPYDDLATGAYEFVLTVRDASNNLVNLTSVGGTAAGTLAGTFSVLRGGQSLPTVVRNSSALEVTPLTTMSHDAHGNVVQSTRHVKGTTGADALGYGEPTADAGDQTSYQLFDSHGHVVRAVDSEGGSKYSSYDAMGRAAKSWQPVTTNDGLVQNAVQVFQYDKLGRQTATIEPSYLPNRTLATNAIQQTLQQQSASRSLAQAGYYVPGDEYTQPYWVPNIVSVGWNEMASWGGGNTRIRVYYRPKVVTGGDAEYGYTYGPGAQTSREFEVGSAATGTNVSWTGDTVWDVQRVIIWKRDVSNNLVQLHDRSSNGAYANRLHFAVPQQPGTTVAFKYKLTSASTWTTGTLYNMGSKYVANTIGLANGSYHYEIQYTRPGETDPSSASRGSFTISGASGSLTNGGTLTAWTPPALDPASFARTQAQYNAFGEIVAKGLNDGWQEYYHYDNAGRLWRTNDKDGVARVYLYDTQGRATAEIKSASLNLATYAAAQDVAALTSGVQRTQTQHDLLGRVTQQVEQAFLVPSMLDAIAAPISMPQMSMGFGLSQAGYYVPGDEYTQPYWVPNVVGVNWNEMASWGGGNTRIRVYYRPKIVTGGDAEYGYTYGPGSQTYREFEIGAAATGTSVSWTGDTVWDVNAVYVWKRNSAGGLVQLHTQAGVTGHSIVWQAPPAVGTQVVFKYKPASGTTWSTATLNNFGAVMQFDTRTLANGTYDYEILYTVPGESQPYAHKTGAFTKGAGAGVTDTTATVLETVSPVSLQTVDRWGNAVTFTDPRGGVSSYRYNYLDKLIEDRKPQTQVWAADGTTSLAQPVARNFYDRLGRAIGTVDPNGNANTARYDAAGQLIAEYHPDGGLVQHNYDVLGRRTRTLDALGNATDYTYDRLDRLTKEKRPIGEDNYAYDELGNRKSTTNALGHTTLYWFDTRGKVIRTKLPGGQEVNAYYDLRGNKVKEVNGNNDTNTWGYDHFGRLNAHTDMGGATHAYAYSFAGQLTQQTNSRGQNQNYAYYENGALKQINDVALDTQTFYQYDAAGNRIREKFIKGTTLHLDNRITFDALNRMTKVADNRYTIVYGYDANGNRRKAVSDYYDNSNNPKHVENWYLYDSMNRITLSQGVLSGGQVQIDGTQGIQLQYDAAGNRRVATSYQGGSPVSEAYNYDANGRLTTTTRGGQVTSSRAYDAAGQVTQTISYSSPGSINERRESYYNSNGWLTQQDVFSGSGTHTQRTLYTGHNALGNVTSYQISIYTGTAYTNYYGYEYAKYDGYKEKKVNGSSSYFQPGSTTTTYDVNGNVASVSETFATSKNRSFLTLTSGQILQKTENGQTQYYFYANDKPVGSSGALSSADFDYNYTPVSSQYPAATPSSYVVSQGDTLQSIALAVFGDPQLWYIIADANGLRTNADLKVGQQLTVPNKITNLHNNDKTFKVYNPGEIIGDTTPTLPDPPPPPQPKGKGGGCGGFGFLVVMIVAIVVTAIVAPYITAALVSTLGATGAAVVGAAGAAAIGSIASQGVGIAIGVQEDFNWSAVGIAALSAGVTQGLGQWAPTGNALADTVIRTAAGNAITQGVSVVVGAQEKFDWRAVAASAVAAGLSHGVGQAVGKELSSANVSAGVTKFASGMASGIVSGVARSVVMGGKVQFASIAADAFGNALGSSLADLVTSGGSQSQDALQAALGADDDAGDFSAGFETAWKAADEPSFGDLPDINMPEVAWSSPVAGADSPDNWDLMGSMPETYAVGKGAAQGYWGIAKELLGPQATRQQILEYSQKLMEMNPGVSTNRIQIGDRVYLPDSSTVASEATMMAWNKADAEYRSFLAEQAAQASVVEAAFVGHSGGPDMHSWPDGELAFGVAGGARGAYEPSFKSFSDPRVQRYLENSVGNRLIDEAGRNQYNETTRANAEAVSERLRSGELAPREAAVEAARFRDAEALRIRETSTSPEMMREIAGQRGDKANEILRDRVNDSARMQEHVDTKLYPSAEQKLRDRGMPNPTPTEVYTEIVESSGRPSPEWNAKAAERARVAQQIGTWAGRAGTVATGVGVALDAASLYGEYQDSARTGNYDNTYRESARIAGGWTGAWIVGKAGAATGAVVGGVAGSFVPVLGNGVGATIGGIVGGVVGAIKGYQYGSQLSTSAYDAARRR